MQPYYASVEEGIAAMTDMLGRNAMSHRWWSPMARAAKHRTRVCEAWTGLPAYRTQPVVFLAICTAIACNKGGLAMRMRAVVSIALLSLTVLGIAKDGAGRRAGGQLHGSRE